MQLAAPPPLLLPSQYANALPVDYGEFTYEELCEQVQGRDKRHASSTQRNGGDGGGRAPRGRKRARDGSSAAGDADDGDGAVGADGGDAYAAYAQMSATDRVQLDLMELEAVVDTQRIRFTYPDWPPDSSEHPNFFAISLRMLGLCDATRLELTSTKLVIDKELELASVMYTITEMVDRRKVDILQAIADAGAAGDDNNPEIAQCESLINASEGVMRQIRVAVSNVLITRAINSPSEHPGRRYEEMLARFENDCKIKRIDPSKLIIAALYDRMVTSGFRIQGSYVWEKIYTKEGRFCYSYRPVKEISQFVHSMYNRFSHPHMWAIIVKSEQSIAENMSKFTAPDARLPTRDEDHISFTNGLYQLSTCAFTLYGEVDLPEEFISRKYIDMRFPIEDVQDVDDYMDLPFKGWSRIFQMQDLQEQALRDALMLFGRLLRKPDRDWDWQVAPFLKGTGGTGKSIIIAAIEEMFDITEIGKISADGETTFGKSSLMNKSLITCSEVKKNFNVSIADIQKMITGESDSVAVKHLEAVKHTWNTQFLLAGNETASWHDCGGAVSRRIVIIPFTKSVDKPDTTLKATVMAELPMILHQINWAFVSRMADEHNLRLEEAEDRAVPLEKVRVKHFWDICDPLYKETQREFRKSSCSLTSFLSSDKIKLEYPIGVPQQLAPLDHDNEHHRVRFDMFEEVYYQYIRRVSCNAPKTTLERDVSANVFHNFKIRRSRYNGAEWLYGVCLADES